VREQLFVLFVLCVVVEDTCTVGEEPLRSERMLKPYVTLKDCDGLTDVLQAHASPAEGQHDKTFGKADERD
jgi:hypothetical protein